ncbi:MAG TPA: substrate-binding domain-containing protein [Micromonosporaceae bacterium]
MTTSEVRPAGSGPGADGRRDRSRPVVGMLTQDLLELFAEQWLGAVDGARAQGCDLICFCGRALEAPGNLKSANAIYDLVGPRSVDGLVVWSSTLGIVVGPERLERFCHRFAPLPIVSVEQPLGSAPLVVMENRQGMQTAVSHLIEVHGRRRIAFLRGPANHDGATDRYRGYLDALADHGLDERPELVSTPPPTWVPEEAAVAVTTMLAAGDVPDAIVAANDDFAVAAMSALASAGVRTPEDIAVVGFDDFTNIGTHDLGFDSAGDVTGAVRRAVNVSPGSLSLTTVRAPFRELGRRAVELVHAMIRGERVPPVGSVPTRLVVRRSCGCRPVASHPVPAELGDPAGQLALALSARSADLPEDWATRLCGAFVAAIRGGPADEFLGLLDRLVQVSLHAGECVENWWRVLYGLRPLIPLDVMARGEELWLDAQMMLNETAERYWRYRSVLAEKRSQIVREVGQRLVTASDRPALARILAEELPRVGIPGCYLAAYEPGAPGRSRLLLAYEHGAPAAIAPDNAGFDSALLVPGGRLARPGPYSLVAAPLSVNDQRLGFVLFELGPHLGWMYAALQEQLGSALHRVLLIERERTAVAALEEAHRRAERHRLASELHDSVSQALFSMTLHTRAIELAVQQEGADANSPVARGLAELRDLTQDALTEMRALIFQLRPEALREEGLVGAIRRHAAAVAAREGFEVSVHAAEDYPPLDDEAEQELFRIVQEALHNSVKHAQPGRVDIRLDEPGGTAGTLVVEVADDGVGFDPDLSYPGHLGLASMRERAQRLGGRFTVDSSPAGSTTVRVEVPDILRRLPADAPTSGTTPG